MSTDNKKEITAVSNIDQSSRTIERIDEMQKFLEGYAEVMIDMEKSMQKSIQCQKELIDWFAKELNDVRKMEVELKNELSAIAVQKSVGMLPGNTSVEEPKVAEEVKATQEEKTEEFSAVEIPEEPVVAESPVEEVAESVEPESTVEPEATAEPEATVEPEVAAEPEVVAEPEKVDQSDIEPDEEVKAEEEPKPIEAPKAKKKGGLFSKLFAKKEKAAPAVEAATVTMAAGEIAVASTVSSLPIDENETEEDKKRRQRLEAAPLPYVGKPADKKGREVVAAEENATETSEEVIIGREEADRISEDDFEEEVAQTEPMVETVEETPVVEKTVEEEPAIEEAVEEAPVVEETVEEIAEEIVEEEVVEEEPTVEETISEEPAIEEVVEEAPVVEETVEEVVEEVVAEEPKVLLYKTEEGRKQIEDLKSDHEREANATERLIDNMYKRHREELGRLSDELNMDTSVYDGYNADMRFPDDENGYRIKELVNSHINEKKAIEALKDKMIARHENEFKALCAELGLDYEDYLIGNY